MLVTVKENVERSPSVAVTITPNDDDGVGAGILTSQWMMSTIFKRIKIQVNTQQIKVY